MVVVVVESSSVELRDRVCYTVLCSAGYAILYPALTEPSNGPVPVQSVRHGHLPESVSFLLCTNQGSANVPPQAKERGTKARMLVALSF